MTRASLAPGMEQATIVRHHRAPHKMEGLDRDIEPVLTFKHARGLGDGGDRQSVPIRQNLIVAPRPDAAFAQREQDGAVSRQRAFRLLVQQLDRSQTVEDGLAAFPIAFAVDAICAFEEWRAHAQRFAYFSFAPSVEFAFLAFAVGVETAGETAARRTHLARDPLDRLGHAQAIQFATLVLPDLGQQFDQLGVVVEHFFKMRHEPSIVGRIAREAAAQMVVDAALRNMVECQKDALAQRVATRPLPGPPEKVEAGRLREFWRGAEAAIHAVEPLLQLFADGVDEVGRYRFPGSWLG